MKVAPPWTGPNYSYSLGSPDCPNKNDRNEMQVGIGHLTDAGFELRRLESARSQSGAARTQRIDGRVDADRGAAGDCNAAEYERMQFEGSCSARPVRSLIARSADCGRGYVPGQGASTPGSGRLRGVRGVACGYNRRSRKG